MEASNWERVVDLVQTTFGEGELAENNTWQEVVMIPKENGTTMEMALWM